MTISRTSKNKRRDAAGFTLIELLLVLALVVVLSAFVAPAMQGTLETIRLDAAAQQVRTAWIDARLEAMRSGVPVAFQCQLGSNAYTLSTLADAPAAAAGAAEVADQVELADDDQEDLGSITFVQLSVGDTTDPAFDPELPGCVVFRPDGATDDAFAILQSADGRQRRISLRGLTGSARVEQNASEEESP